MTGASCYTVVKVAPMAVAGVVGCVEVMIPAAVALLCFHMTQQKTVIIIAAANVMNTAIINGGTMKSIPVIIGNVTYYCLLLYLSNCSYTTKCYTVLSLQLSNIHITVQAHSG